MKTTIDLPSKRQYAVAYIEGDAALTLFPTLADILNDTNDEWKYAIQMEFDKLLDMKIGDRIILNFNRDNSDSGGYIKRIK